ncbi:MAG: protein-disulfide reductase DsbD [Gammaproteobacteria bacterium]|nr:MAG: protein-disulfide reductase DsbD [Gammaproteobacteria bacterium]
MPSSLVFPKANFQFFRSLCIVMICLQVSLANAVDFTATPNANVSPAKATNFSNEEKYLPVTEAYKLKGEISDTGNTKHLQLIWTIAPDYYLYQERFKFQATPELTLTPSYNEGKKKFDEFAGKDMTLHYHQAIVDFSLASQTAPFDLRITSQGCAEAGLCYPPYTETLHIDPTTNSVTPIANQTTPANKPSSPQTSDAPESTSLWLWQALLFAGLGGIILNLMPCVFPVLSIKVLSLVQADSARLRLHGWAYTLGIVLCFIAFASMLLIAKSGGEAIGWGFQLQSPGLIIALAYLFFVMGLSMSGVIQFGTRWMGAGQSLTQKSGLAGSFFTGVLAAVVASPCTAPFMATALGFALTQPAFVCLGIFTALGFGMALPLLLLCYLPNLAGRLPKPGVWMETLKEFLAFPLYLSAIWLLWVLTNQVNSNLMAGVCIGAVLIAFAFWLYQRPARGFTAKSYQLIALLSLVIAIFLPYQLLQKKTVSDRWQAYSPALLQELREEGRPVFIDLTADWCLTCLANERVTLSKAEVEAVFDEQKVATLKGDMTNPNDDISALLTEYGRSGVPLYLWYPANRPGKADVLPQLLTPDLVISTLKGKK